ncbi:MAG: family 1 glycosylhydrolase [Chakrabartia sp.]
MPANDPLPPLALWAGVECSVVRVGDEYRNQIVETGHADRMEDLDLLAGLGVSTLRYPIIWETISPDGSDAYDWRWTDARLHRLRDLGIRVIAGLVHHGSGPRHTSLVDPLFPEKLARFAEAAAQRYPWIDLWTPVNEPLTTARFACLYGHWYPHARDFGSFVRASVCQCRAVALAMEAIRRITPHAQLIQTEDLGRSFATRRLAYQAAHENERRWLSLDLLTGRMTPSHRWHRGLLKYGVADADLAELRDGKGMPDMIGINHYLTSDRYLDDRVHLYPDQPVGGNGHHQYVDTEAVRVPEADGRLGLPARLREAWARYRLPLAVTEAHNSCTREEQLRWFTDIWTGAEAVRAEGADIRAVTLWSVFGAVDWSSLLTRSQGDVEPGLFDFSGPKPRPTLVAKAAAQLAQGQKPGHPVLETPGWWARETRFVRDGRLRIRCTPSPASRPLLITGATGTLGRALKRVCTVRGLHHVVTSRAECDITDAAAIDRTLAGLRPWAVINAAGFVRVAEAQAQRDRCFAENATGPGLLAAACAQRDLPFVTFSSDLVFDGGGGRPYREDDPTNPLCAYGASKSAAETLVAAAWAKSLVIRTSAFFGPWDRFNFVWSTLNRLHRGEKMVASALQRVSPTYVPDLVNGTLDLLLDGETGIWHLANKGEISWYDLARIAARQARLDAALIEPAPDGPSRSTALATGRGLILPDLDRALGSYLREAETAWAA